ncbi:MAG TPA: M28 family peptidase [Bacillota bacterium]|nr:M28 family peptidase [Bacillota bacterium]
MTSNSSFTAGEQQAFVGPAGLNTLEGVPVQVNPVSPWDHPATGEGPFKYAVQDGYALSVARRLTGFKNNHHGFRMAGSGANREVALFLKDEMTALGLTDVQIRDFPVYGWTFSEASLAIGDIQFNAVPYVSTPSTSASGLTAPLVFAGNGTRHCYENLQVENKIVLIGLDYRRLPWPSLAALQAQQYGAAAVVIFNENSYGQGHRGTALTQQDWRNHAPSIPVVNVSPNCGRTLARAASAHPLTVKLLSLTGHNPSATAGNVIGTLPGRLFPHEYILLAAHFDGYFQGFQDNALGVGVALAVLKGLIESGYRPRRTIVLALVDAEEFGSKGVWDDWLIGSWNLVRAQRRWCGRVIAVINLELMAYRRSRAIGARACDELVTFLGSYGHNYGPSSEAFPEAAVRLYRGVATRTGEWPYSFFGLPTCGSKADPEMMEQYYHTQYDTPDLVCPRKADEMVRFYGGLLLRLDNCLYHPYDLSVRPQEYLASLKTRELSALGVDTREVVKEAAALHMEALALRQKILSAEERYQKILTGAREKRVLKALRQEAQEYNAAVRALLREIMQETQFLGSAYPEAIVARAVHYQHDFSVLHQLEKLIAAGRVGEAAELMTHPEHGPYGLSYVGEMTREVFQSHFIAGFFGQGTDHPANWTSGRVLEYHDLWEAVSTLNRGRISAGAHRQLLNRVKQARSRAEKNLRLALAQDAALWRRARQALQKFPPLTRPG